MTERWDGTDVDPEEMPRSAAEDTLRSVTRIAAPEGIEDRIHRRLAVARREPESRGIWSLWSPVRKLQFAGAAAVAIALGISIWSVSHPVQQVAPQAVAPAPQVVTPKAAPAEGFRTAGAERRPSTLAPIKVQPAAKKKPSASHAAKPATRPAAQAQVAPNP